MNTAEKQFKQWLDDRDYSYFVVDQTPETFARFFKGITKRPDFIVVINRVGLIAVDVKDKAPHKKGDYILDESDEIEKYLHFERLTRIPVWFAFSSAKDHYNNWMWIPLSKVLECPLRTPSAKSWNRPFRAIPPADCIVIQAKKDGIARIIE